MRKLLKNKSFQDGVVVTLLGAALMFYGFYMFYNVKVKSTWIMSPYLFPVLLSVFALILGMTLMLTGVSTAKRENGGEKADEKNSGMLLRVLVVVALSVVYYILLTWLGFIPATALFLAALMAYMGERRWYVLLLVAVLTPFVMYLIFHTGLNVRLP